MVLEQAKKKCFISADKSQLATILKLFDLKEMFEALDRNYSITNSTCLYQLLRHCQATSNQKNVSVVEKYETMLNLNTKICI